MIGVPVSYDKFHEVYKWCVKTFGDDHDRRWYMDHQLYYDPEFIFLDEQDAVLFMLRWT